MAKAPPKPELGGFRLALIKLWVRAHCILYRLTNGRIGGRLENSSILLLTTVGRKSGVRRTTPVIFLPTGRSYAIVASLAGADRHPAWYLNLEASHEADVQVLDKRIHVTTQTVDAERRKELWPELVAIYPPYAEYQTRTTRIIPVIELFPS
jgi:deazaflavin-dependent oxidoreductase (nitroreductase family)